MYLGSCFLRPPCGAVWRGRALGMARWRYVAWHAWIPRECLAVETVTSLSQIPNPMGCRARPGAHPGHGSGLKSACPVSCSTLWAVGWGRSSPIWVRSTAQGQSQPSPKQGHSGTWDPIPCTPALWLPLCPTPHPGSTQAHGGTRVKSCPKLFLAVFQLGINGLGRRLGNASCAGPSPFVASPVSKFPLQTSIFQEFSNQPNDRCLEPGAGSSPGPQP